MTIQKMAAVGVASVLSCVIATTAAQSQVRINGSTATFALPNQTNQAARGMDFANAKPMVLPAARTLPPAQAQAIASALDPLQVFGAPGAEEGDPGTGELNQVQLVAPQDVPQGSGIEPEEFGTSAQPFTTSEVNAIGDLTVNYYPYLSLIHI